MRTLASANTVTVSGVRVSDRMLIASVTVPIRPCAARASRNARERRWQASGVPPKSVPSWKIFRGQYTRPGLRSARTETGYRGVGAA